MRDPIAGEFQRGFDEISMGVSVPESLSHMADRVELMDVKFFVTSVNIQRETGGNLAEIVDSLGRLIRKRFELKKKVRALSADGRISASSNGAALHGAVSILSIRILDAALYRPYGSTMLAERRLMIFGIVMKKMIAIKV
jgi:tight adherence protein B